MKTAAQTKDAPTPIDAPKVLKLTKAQQTAVDKLTTVSARIRYLADQNYTRSQITKLITNATGGELRYQHVRNVLVTPVAKPKS